MRWKIILSILSNLICNYNLFYPTNIRRPLFLSVHPMRKNHKLIINSPPFNERKIKRKNNFIDIIIEYIYLYIYINRNLFILFIYIYLNIIFKRTIKIKKIIHNKLNLPDNHTSFKSFPCNFHRPLIQQNSPPSPHRGEIKSSRLT